MSRLLMAALFSAAMGVAAPVERMMTSIPSRVPPKPMSAEDKAAIERARQKRERRAAKRRCQA